MNARAAKEAPMHHDPHIVKLESGVQHLQSDVTEIKADIKSLWAAVEALMREFLSFKADVERQFGSVRTSMERDFGSVRTAVERDFGQVRAAIERAKLWMLVTGVGTILSIWGAAFALGRFLKP
jgi:hypothetical protein